MRTLLGRSIVVALVVSAAAATPIACAGKTGSGDVDSGGAHGDSSPGKPHDAGSDGLSPDAVAAIYTADCMKFCALIEGSFPQCTHFMGGLSCSTWCAQGAEESDATFTTCAQKVLTYESCVTQPDNLQGCTDAGEFVYPACEAADEAVRACIRQ
jgi:hypothetical protein